MLSSHYISMLSIWTKHSASRLGKTVTLHLHALMSGPQVLEQRQGQARWRPQMLLPRATAKERCRARPLKGAGLLEASELVLHVGASL